MNNKTDKSTTNGMFITNLASDFRGVRQMLYTANPFFKGSIVFEVFDDYIVFRKPTIDDTPRKVTKNKKAFNFGITNENLPIGYHTFSEITEDEIIIDFN